MRLVRWTQINYRYFAKGSRPSERDWANEILAGRINGKIIFNTVFIDVDDFLSKDEFSDPFEGGELDLLAD